MIKQGVNIRKFSTLQRKMLQKIGFENGIKTVPKILFFCVDKVYDYKADLARKDRIIAYKQSKIVELKEKIELLTLEKSIDETD